MKSLIASKGQFFNRYNLSHPVRKGFRIKKAVLFMSDVLPLWYGSAVGKTLEDMRVYALRNQSDYTIDTTNLATYGSRGTRGQIEFVFVEDVSQEEFEAWVLKAADCNKIDRPKVK